MSENLQISSGSKEEKYSVLIPQIEALLKSEEDLIANMANISSVLKETFNFWWVGFYRVIKNELVLGPFQGPLACTRIKFGKGVCGTAWKNGSTIIVPDVEKFPGHIACSSRSRSEIVVPIKVNGQVVAVLDIDSVNLYDFDDIDALNLEKIAYLISM